MSVKATKNAAGLAGRSSSLDVDISYAQEKLSEEIKAIASAVRRMKDGPVQWDVLVHLIAWRSGVGAGQVKNILEAILELQRTCLK